MAFRFEDDLLGDSSLNPEPYTLNLQKAARLSQNDGADKNN